VGNNLTLIDCDVRFEKVNGAVLFDETVSEVSKINFQGSSFRGTDVQIEKLIKF